jgi:DNA-binding PucR family transcriptional regulator
VVERHAASQSGELDVKAEEVIAAITAAADAQLPEISAAIVGRLIGEIEHFAGDQPILDQLNAGASHNFSITMQILRHDIDIEQVGPSAPAIEIARLLAQRDIPITALEHAYRLYQESVVRWCLQELAELSDNAAVTAYAALEITTLVSAHVNLIAQQLLSTYEFERDAWRLRRSASRSARIGDLLSGRPVDSESTERVLGYRFRQYHLGLVLWTDRGTGSGIELARLETAATTLTGELGIDARPLFEARDAHMARAWVPLGTAGTVDQERVAAIKSGWTDPIMVSIGDPRAGVEGFVRTHNEADAARLVVQAAKSLTSGIVCASELGAVTLMCSDLGATRAWVADILGPLVADDPSAAQLRATLREFLRTGGSYAAAAETLHMHKNSVVYRIRKIEDQLGCSVRDHRLDLENALELAFWLGAAVLGSHVGAEPAPGGQIGERLHATVTGQPLCDASRFVRGV